MEIKQSFVVDHPTSLVWEFFRDVESVAECMPGATLTAPSDGKHLEGKIGVKLGPISASFAGEADIERNDETHAGAIRGGGRDTRSGSRAKGEVRYALAEEKGGEATRVDVTIDFTLSGALAQFNRPGLVNDLASRLTADFASNLQARLDTAKAPTAGIEPPSGAAAAPPPSGRTAREIDAGSLLWQVIWARIKAVFGGLVGKK